MIKGTSSYNVAVRSGWEYDFVVMWSKKKKEKKEKQFENVCEIFSH